MWVLGITLPCLQPLDFVFKILRMCAPVSCVFEGQKKTPYPLELESQELKKLPDENDGN